MAEESILYGLEDGVATITLNRPDRLNSFNPDMHLALREALASAAKEARAVLLTGAGRGFCAGQDLSDRSVAADEAPPDIGASIDLYYKPLILQIKRLPMPVICAVNGVAAGAGPELRHRHRTTPCCNCCSSCAVLALKKAAASSAQKTFTPRAVRLCSSLPSSSSRLASV